MEVNSANRIPRRKTSTQSGIRTLPWSQGSAKLDFFVLLTFGLTRNQVLGLLSHEVVLEKLHFVNFWLISEITICQKVLPSPAKDSCPKGKTSRWSLWSWCDRIERFDWLYRVGSRSAPIGGNQSKHSEAPWIANQTRKRKTRNSTIYPTRCAFWRIRNWFTFGQWDNLKGVVDKK